MALSFTEPGLLERLEVADSATLDAAPFGVIALAPDGIVTGYNATESQISGLSPQGVIGRHFFSAVAPCTNNFMVAHRFETEPALDVVIDYVFSLRMRPTAVKLRLLKHPRWQRMYLVVQRS